MELAILSARIFTGDPSRPWAQALLIRDDRIVELGTDQQVKAACEDSSSHVLELPGRLITPGLVDAHCHFGYLGLSLLAVDLRNQPSLAACRERIREAAATAKPDEWILGRGWDQFQWDDSREPTLEDLDDVTPHNPAMMVRVCGHSVAVNSLALARAGIARESPDPPGGRIERDPNSGEPNGLLREARYLIERVMPSPTEQDWKDALLASQEVSLRGGLTGVHSFETLHQWAAMQALEAEGRLKIRVHASIQGYELKKAASLGLKPGAGSERLWLGHVKLFADGSLGSGTALLHEPYADDADQSGIAVTSVEDLQQSVEAAYAAGYDVAIHAIGDKATTHCLMAISGAREKAPGVHRDSIEHVQLLRPEDVALFRELGVVASVQPVFLPTDWHVAEKRWGEERCRSGGYAWKSILEAGIPMQFGSDAPVEPNAPLLGLQAAVTRQTLAGEPEGGWLPDQRLTLEQGLKGFTRVAAWTARREDDLGIIAPSRRADLTIFEGDLFQAPVQDWPAVGVEMTIIDGEIVHQK
jgi:predicted amidohydrolase YtcJ